MSWLRNLFGRNKDRDAAQPPTDPLDLVAAWEELLDEGERAVENEDAAALAATVSAAGPIRQTLDGLDPLAVLDAAGLDGFLRVTEFVDDSRGFVWRLLAAAELVSAERLDEGRDLIRDLPRPRIPFGAEPFFATLLPPLFAVDPSLAVRLGDAGLYPFEGLELLGASGDLETIRAVGSALEASDHRQTWETKIVAGARRRVRPEIVEALLPLVTRNLPADRSRSDRLPAASRRQTLHYQLGELLVAAGKPAGGLDAWEHLESRYQLTWEVGELVRAGFPEEARRLVNMLPEDDRDEGRKHLAEAGLEDEADESAATDTKPKDTEPKDTEPQDTEPKDGFRALERGDREEPERVLESLRTRASAARGTKKAWHLVDVIRLSIGLDRKEEAAEALVSIETQLNRTRSEKNRVILELALAQGEIALGRLAGGSERLLRWSGELEDHDQSYDVIADAVEVVAESGGVQGLEELLASLPEPSDEIFYRSRLVADIAFRFADLGQVDQAFSTAESLDDAVDRDQALEFISMAFLHRQQLAEAERAAAALRGSMAAFRLGEVARACAKAGLDDDARRLFDQALSRAGTLSSAGRLVLEAAAVGAGDGARALVSRSLPELLGEPSNEERERWTQAARRDARIHLRGRQTPQGWLQELRIYEIPEERIPSNPGSDRIRALAGRARWLASPDGGDGGEARRLAAAAVDEWCALGRSDEPIRHSQQADSIPVVSAAADELDVGRQELLTDLRTFIVELDEFIHDNLRARWRAGIVGAFARLGAWPEAIAIGRDITDASERIRILQPLALECPLKSMSGGGWTAFLAVTPVRLALLARLGRESKKAHRIATFAIVSSE